ncbi:hypothetical protein WBJ53_29700 [Spirosoma sp. SC4-14]|uniref:hypothetical protein n=1 Tax=Spirosoma sp. SC4-14 TaxID=3128900 RepID=UPI0030CF7135
MHIQLGDKLSNDIAIYEKEKVTVKGKCFDVAPTVVVEVDIKIDLEAFPAMEQDYVYTKTQSCSILEPSGSSGLRPSRGKYL